jgi:hypothetical protein
MREMKGDAAPVRYFSGRNHFQERSAEPQIPRLLLLILRNSLQPLFEDFEPPFQLKLLASLRACLQQ